MLTVSLIPSWWHRPAMLTKYSVKALHIAGITQVLLGPWPSLSVVQFEFPLINLPRNSNFLLNSNFLFEFEFLNYYCRY